MSDRSTFVQAGLDGGRRQDSDAGALPAITRDTALFLDVDGTLADLTATPEDTSIDAATRDAVIACHASLDGALALVTGRMIKDVDRLLAPRLYSVAGLHGAEMRLGRDDCLELSEVPTDAAHALALIATALRPLVAEHAGLMLEEKTLALSLHYRAAPEQAALCWQAAAEAVRGKPAFEARPGKMVVEIGLGVIDKGSAVQRFMSRPPFAGRRPIFVGDDAGDEPAIIAVQARGGVGVRIVDGPHTASAAHVRVTDPLAVRAWLARGIT